MDSAGIERRSARLYVGEWQRQEDEQLLLAQAAQAADDVSVRVVRFTRALWDTSPTSSSINTDANVDAEADVDEHTRRAIQDAGLTTLPALVITIEGSIIETRVLALSSFTRGEDDEQRIAAHVSKGLAFYECWDLLQAAACFESVLRIDPSHHSARYNLACILHAAALPLLAMGHLLTVLLSHSDDHLAHSLLWTIASILPSSPATAATYRQLAARGDIQAEMRLAALTNDGQYASKGHSDYIKNVFNRLAETFEDKLVTHLQYEAPWLLRQQVDQHCRGGRVGSLDVSKRWRVLDLGCGSGLCGKAFEGLVPASPRGTRLCSDVAELSHSLIQATDGWMVGIDLSDEMVRIASGLDIYDATLVHEVQDVLDHLAAHHEYDGQQPALLCDLVLSGDTFIYVGALGNVFSKVHTLLEKDGLFAFSTEDLATSESVDRACVASVATGDSTASTAVTWSSGEPEGAVAGWGVRLSRSVRYAHSHQYIVLLAERYGFEIISADRHVLRTEEGTPLMGFMYLLRKICV